MNRRSFHLILQDAFYHNHILCVLNVFKKSKAHIYTDMRGPRLERVYQTYELKTCRFDYLIDDAMHEILFTFSDNVVFLTDEIVVQQSFLWKKNFKTILLPDLAIQFVCVTLAADVHTGKELRVQAVITEKIKPFFNTHLHYILFCVLWLLINASIFTYLRLTL